MDNFGDFRATPCWATSISHDSGNPNSSPRQGDSAADGLARRGAAGAAALWPGRAQGAAPRRQRPAKWWWMVFFWGGKTWGKHGENGENNGTLCLFFEKWGKLWGKPWKVMEVWGDEGKTWGKPWKNSGVYDCWWGIDIYIEDGESWR